VGRRVRRHRQDLVDAADLSARGGSNLRVLGSVARSEDRPEGILGTRVDLIPAADLKPDVRERVESDLITL
jgi:predicted nucleotidyltransferase